MEVHHPHHLTHKKKWSEYLLEFLMLFFAVFLGFLAENYREHKIEEGRVERHMHTMVENLKYDTTRYGVNLRANLLFGRGLDSFRYQINQAIAGNVDANKLYYYYWRYGRNANSAVVNTAAMTQLKNSGMIRMIEDDDLVAEMGDYYERRLTALQNSRDGVGRARETLTETYRLFFSYQGFDELLQRDTTFVSSFDNAFFQKYFADIINRDPPLNLLPTADGNFQRLYDDVAATELALRNYNSFVRYARQGADSLMAHIREEYGTRE